MIIQVWPPLKLTGLISLLSKGILGIFSSTTVQRHQFFGGLPSLWSSSQNYTWPLGWPYCPLDNMELCWQSNVSAFQHIVWVCHCFPTKMQSSSDFMAAVTIHSEFGAQEEDILSLLPPCPLHLPWGNEAECHDLSVCCVCVCVCLIFSLKPAFSLSSFTLIKRLFLFIFCH